MLRHAGSTVNRWKALIEILFRFNLPTSFSVGNHRSNPSNWNRFGIQKILRILSITESINQRALSYYNRIHFHLVFPWISEFSSLFLRIVVWLLNTHDRFERVIQNRIDCLSTCAAFNAKCLKLISLAAACQKIYRVATERLNDITQK